MEHSGSLSARSPRQRPDVMQLPEPEEERREQAQAQNAVPPKTEASTKTAASNGDRGTMIPGLSLLPPATFHFVVGGRLWAVVAFACGD